MCGKGRRGLEHISNCRYQSACEKLSKYSMQFKAYSYVHIYTFFFFFLFVSA